MSRRRALASQCDQGQVQLVDLPNMAYSREADLLLYCTGDNYGWLSSFRPFDA